MDARADFADSDGLGAIFPPMIYNAIVLKCLGVPDDDPEMRWVMKQLDDLVIEEDDTLRLQPCLSPVWDTALSLIGAGRRRASRAIRSEVETAVRWLLDKEVRQPGDWAKTVRGVEPGGWFFEYRNALLPRHRRHGDGADRAGPHRARDAAPRAGRPSTGRSTGCWRCRTATAAGPRSTATSTTRS